MNRRSCGFQRLGKAAHGGRNVLDSGQTCGNAAQNVALLDLHAVVVAQIGGTVKRALGTVEVHAVVDFYDTLGIKAALDQRAGHAVGHRLIEIEKPQGNGVCRAERILLERAAEVV